MIIFGWLVLVVISCYVTFCFVAGNMVSFGFSGKSMGWFFNLFLALILLALWYLVVTQFPFEVRIQ